MHSGDKLTGTLCRCITCAAKRQGRINREATVRRPEEFATLAHRKAESKIAMENVRKENARIDDEFRELTEDVRKELIGEEA